MVIIEDMVIVVITRTTKIINRASWSSCSIKYNSMNTLIPVVIVVGITDDDVGVGDGDDDSDGDDAIIKLPVLLLPTVLLLVSITCSV